MALMHVIRVSEIIFWNEKIVQFLKFSFEKDLITWSDDIQQTNRNEAHKFFLRGFELSVFYFQKVNKWRPAVHLVVKEGYVIDQMSSYCPECAIILRGKRRMSFVQKISSHPLLQGMGPTTHNLFLHQTIRTPVSLND